MSRPIVLLDSDGVLSAFTAGYLDVIWALTGERHEVEEVDRWDLHECPFFVELDKRSHFGKPPGTLRARVEERISGPPGFCAGLRPLPGAREGVAALQAVADVYVVTSPWWSSPHWLAERTAWLHAHMGIPAARVIHASAKHLVTGDVLVDDKPGNVRTWRHGVGLLWDAHHNRGAETADLTRVSTWDAVLEAVRTERGVGR